MNSGDKLMKLSHGEKVKLNAKWKSLLHKLEDAAATLEAAHDEDDLDDIGMCVEEVNTHINDLIEVIARYDQWYQSLSQVERQGVNGRRLYEIIHFNLDDVDIDGDGTDDISDMLDDLKQLKVPDLGIE